jgi:hypothetical protein
MGKTMKITIKALLFSLFISMTSISFAEYGYISDNTVTDSDIIIDLTMARPLGILGSAVGMTLHAVGLLFSVPGENFGEVGEVLVEAPLNYTFNRPLGQFDSHD